MANPADDGFLTLPEIYELNLKSCELAILSACETNYGPQQKGEGVWALSRGFLVAGARRVVASNWLVDDEAAASLISYFCAGIAKARSHGEAADHATALHRRQALGPPAREVAKPVLLGHVRAGRAKLKANVSETYCPRQKMRHFDVCSLSPPASTGLVLGQPQECPRKRLTGWFGPPAQFKASTCELGRAGIARTGWRVKSVTAGKRSVRRGICCI